MQPNREGRGDAAETAGVEGKYSLEGEKMLLYETYEQRIKIS